MIFTREDILKIQNALLQLGRKDSEFKDANTPLNSDDEIAILQDGINKKVSINNLLSTLGLLKKDDFINVSDRYDEYYIQLSEAVTIIAKNKRKKGLVITFQDLNGDWQIYQFTGEVQNFVKTKLWKGLFDFKYPIVNSVLPDEEDLTLTYPDSEGNSFIQLKDKEYDPENFSGMATKILRKNIVEVGGVKKNILTQEDFDQENCIYEIRYDFNLNGQAIIIPNNCILQFTGGSLNNGHIVGNNTLLTNYIKLSVNLSGAFLNVKYYASWFIDYTPAQYSQLLQWLFNIENTVFILDKSIEMSGSSSTVDHVIILGQYGHLFSITNPDAFTFSNTVYVKDINFINASVSILFYNKNTAQIPLIYIDNVDFNGNSACARFINILNQSTIERVHIVNNQIYNLTESAILLRCNINGGIISNNTIYNIGNPNSRATYGIVLSGWQDTITYHCTISNNNIYNLQAEYTATDESKELKGIIVYGQFIRILNNNITNLYSKSNIDPGAESEGIYLKGANSVIEGNRLVNASGNKYSDGAITLKGYSTSEEILNHSVIIRNNYIKNDRHHGIGIIAYNINTIIEGNIIMNTNDQEGIEVFSATSPVICNNYIQCIGDGEILSTSSIAIASTVDGTVQIVNNTLEAFSITIYSKTPIVIRGNIVYIKDRESGTNVQFNSILNGGSSSDVLFANNTVIFENSGSSQLFNQISASVIGNTFIIKPTRLQYICRTDSCCFYDNIFNIQHTSNVTACPKNLDSYDTIAFINNIFNVQVVMPDSVQTYNNKVLSIKNIGGSADFPSITVYNKGILRGAQYFDTDTNKLFIANTEKWYNPNGVLASTPESGNFANKPTIQRNNIPIGFQYLCTDKQTSEGATNGIMLYHKGNDIWVDALGREIN